MLERLLEYARPGLRGESVSMCGGRLWRAPHLSEFWEQSKTSAPTIPMPQAAGVEYLIESAHYLGLRSEHMLLVSVQGQRGGSNVHTHHWEGGGASAEPCRCAFTLPRNPLEFGERISRCHGGGE